MQGPPHAVWLSLRGLSGGEMKPLYQKVMYERSDVSFQTNFEHSLTLQSRGVVSMHRVWSLCRALAATGAVPNTLF